MNAKDNKNIIMYVRIIYQCKIKFYITVLMIYKGISNNPAKIVNIRILVLFFDFMTLVYCYR